VIDAFTAHLPVRIRFGEGAIGELAGLAAGRSVLVLTERPVLEIDAVATAVAGMPVYEKPVGEPTAELIADAAERISLDEPELLVAIGGGSVLDLAKGARLVAGQGIPIERFLAGDAAIAPPRTPLVSVPTTSGTGSEVSGGVVLLDPVQRRKVGVAHPLLRAQDALVDPLLTVGLPPEPTAWTGADALAQAIGGVIVSNSNPPSVALGLEACRHIAAGLERAVTDGSDTDSRAEMSLGSLLAGLSMNLSDCGADHALGHAIGSTFDLPHGLTVGLVLAETLDVNRPACAGRLERVADALDEPDDDTGDGSRAIAAVERLLAAISFPTLRHAGVTDQDVGGLVELALADYCITVNPRTWDADDVRSAYGAALAFDGRP
jgi:alcohol dehydrogenase